MLKWKVWLREDIPAEIPALSGKGKRLIIARAGSKKAGLLSDALLLYRGANSPKSSDWLCKKALPSIAQISKKAALALDRAAYRAMLAERAKPPAAKANKAELIKCIKK